MVSLRYLRAISVTKVCLTQIPGVKVDGPQAGFRGRDAEFGIAYSLSVECEIEDDLCVGEDESLAHRGGPSVRDEPARIRIIRGLGVLASASSSWDARQTVVPQLSVLSYPELLALPALPCYPSSRSPFSLSRPKDPGRKQRRCEVCFQTTLVEAETGRGTGHLERVQGKTNTCLVIRQHTSRPRIFTHWRGRKKTEGVCVSKMRFMRASARSISGLACSILLSWTALASRASAEGCEFGPDELCAVVAGMGGSLVTPQGKGQAHRGKHVESPL